MIATQLPTHENTNHLVDTVDLKDALREVDTDRGKLGHERLLRWEYNILDYGVVHRREQEPSIPSIEMAFSKLKALLRKAAARTIPDLWQVIRNAIPTFKPRQCANYFEAAGYEPV